jgi:phospholipase C
MTPPSADLPAAADPIEHIVLLMLENRSFDRMLGAFQRIFPNLDGVDVAAPRSNADETGQAFSQTPIASNTVKPDPKHETKNVSRQIDQNNSNFVLDYAVEYPDATTAQRQEIMAYHDLDGLPALHRLARDFTICDRWYSSVPGPTWTNRLFALSGTSLGRVLMPDGAFNLNLHLYNQPTIFDRLNEQGISWKVYFHDFPLSWVLVHQLDPGNLACYDSMEQFHADAAGPAASFPKFSFIEPKYMWPGQNDDHAPHDSRRAQELIAGVYNAIRGNADLWNSTLLVLLYDEHGGFYDHVPPPAAVPPDGHSEEYTFDRLGVRVPALLISPWVERSVVSTVFDHTSLLKYLTDKWGLGPLTARVAQANSIAASVRTCGTPWTDTAESIQMPMGVEFTTLVEDAGEASDSMNENQQAIVAFSRFLETKIQDAPENKVRRFLHVMDGIQPQFRVAQERVNLLLAQAKKRMAVADTPGHP